MLKDDDFRRLALGMADTIEGAHMGHPDFRVHGRIFASLHHDRKMSGVTPMAGMVALSPEQQQLVMQDHPAAFTPESGAWGRSGYTRVQLNAVDEDALGEALTLAWQNAVSKPAKTKAATTRTVKPRAAAKPASKRSR